MAEPLADPTGGSALPETGTVARVVIDSPLPQLDHLFDYAIPEKLRGSVVPGVRVKVPLRSANRVAAAYVVEVVETSDFGGALTPLDELVSDVPVLTPEVWSLARRLSERSAGGASDILRLAIPSRQVRVEKAWKARRLEASGQAPGSESDDTAPQPGADTDVDGVTRAEPVANRGRDDHAGTAETAADAADVSDGLIPISGYRDSVWHTVAGGGRLALDAVPSPRETASGAPIGSWARTLAELAHNTVVSGRTAVLLTPDYRDQDQLEAALADVLPLEQISRVDARQSNAERYASFLDLLDDRPRAIVGNRSAIYAPSARLGLIAMWDDGDHLYREPLAPYVHARDAALVRQEESGAALVILSHGRSVETERLVQMGWFTAEAPKPLVAPRIIQTARQDQPDAASGAARIPSTAWRIAREALETGPVLVQVARPGYAPAVACANCSHLARCRECHGPLGVTRAGATPACTVCGALAVNWQCDTCEHKLFKLVTRGSGRTAEELGKAFPGHTVIVSDGERNVQTIERRASLVVATRGAEPLVPGGYAAVLLLDGERMLAAESLSIAEDCLRWWSNAAALAAPRAPVVLTGVAGTLGTALANWDQSGFARQELDDRRALRFPPAVRVVALTGTADSVDRAIDDVRAEHELPPGAVLGPTPHEKDQVRAVIRTDYALAQRLAKSLRASVVKAATSRRRPPAAKGGYRPAPTLKVHFDDPEIFQ
ncbi:primosomal protein N' family DNA-binding protein [Okibacterium fritillariae]|uniref:Probable replication restart protein PriA n=1 Tax=Okibacterium fritillariae TaxID=123320 RepID=A0A1T5JIB1_9MICO|nr:primosomal protein N' [Okibacterium fritillariae]SKC50918.1 replication restart DNA helicase PriA [Okibacterium fritillariae]